MHGPLTPYRVNADAAANAMAADNHFGTNAGLLSGLNSALSYRADANQTAMDNEAERQKQYQIASEQNAHELQMKRLEMQDREAERRSRQGLLSGLLGSVTITR